VGVDERDVGGVGFGNTEPRRDRVENRSTRGVAADDWSGIDEERGPADFGRAGHALVQHLLIRHATHALMYGGQVHDVGMFR